MDQQYKDDDLVYVDPDQRVVIGIVQWSNSGRPKALAIPKAEVVEEDETDAKPDAKGKRRVSRRQRYYPWGTYRTMKKIYKIEGKVITEKTPLTLDAAIEKCLVEPFWD